MSHKLSQNLRMLLTNKRLQVVVFISTCIMVMSALAAVQNPNQREVQAESVVQSSMSIPQPYIEFQVYGGTVVTDTTMPPVLPNGQADYYQIFAEHNLCALVANGQIDEVWIWAGNGDGVTKGHMWEWVASGPGWYTITPDCGKVVTTMTYNYLREVDVALESFNHRVETFFGHYFPCDFSTATWPWAGSTTWPYSQCGSLLSDLYGFVARPFANNNNVGGCGDAHHPPNIINNQEYNYSDPTTVQTICPSWSEDGSSIPVSLNCQAWGCTHWGFHVWWMQNVPGFNNTNKDRNGNLHNNWWPYLFGIPPQQFRIYLPLIQTNNPNSNLIPETRSLSVLTREPTSGFATKAPTTISPDMENFPERGINLQSSTILSSQPAITTRKVYVIFYPGYGGSPRAEVNLLTAELIGLLKESTTYHGYSYATFRGTFMGQDGKSYAGTGCTTGTVPDNIHIRLNGLKSGVQPVSYRVDEYAGGGVWATPCNPVSNWLLYVTSPSPDQADLYFKPFRYAPDGTIYTVTVQYDDGLSQTVQVIGSAVIP